MVPATLCDINATIARAERARKNVINAWRYEITLANYYEELCNEVFMLDEEIWDFKNKSKEELSWGDLQDHSERLNELQELYLAAIERRDKHQWESVSEASKRKERYMEEYAKASCLSLCENMCIALPRELRDMVYEYLIGDTTVFVDRAARHASRSPIVSWPFSSMPYTYSKISHGRLCTTTSSFQDSPLHPTSSIVHCWNYEFVGHDMLKEMPHTWYRTTTFIFLDPSVFRSFFECDLWKCGLDPRELVQSVNVSWTILSNFDLLGLLKRGAQINVFIWTSLYSYFYVEDADAADAHLLENFKENLNLLRMARSKGHHVQAHAGHMLVLLNDEDFELAKWNAGFDQFRVPFYSPTKCHMQRNPDEIDNIFELAEFSEREEKSDSGPVIRPTKGLITQNGIVSVSFTHDAVGIVGVTV